MRLRLIRHAPIKGTLYLKSGLHTGGSKGDLEIGGMDNPVIRHPLTNLPYIPGSSLKGKMRSLLELKAGLYGDRGKPCGCADCMVCRVFGPHSSDPHRLGPTRIIVRDATMKAESEKVLEALRKEGSLYVELKSEIWIDRDTLRAGHGGLRQQERVPEGTEFDLNISVRIFHLGEKKRDDEGEDKDVLDFIKRGLKLITEDTLGGSGTRGSGWVGIKGLTIDGEPVDLETVNLYARHTKMWSRS